MTMSAVWQENELRNSLWTVDTLASRYFRLDMKTKPDRSEQMRGYFKTLGASLVAYIVRGEVEKEMFEIYSGRAECYKDTCAM
jgi:hypothetical protein